MSHSKQAIRASMKEFLAGVSVTDRHKRSLDACTLLASTKEFKAAQIIMLFLSMQQEVETATLAVKAWQEGKSIAAPRVDWQGRRMEPVEIKSLDVGLKETQFGVREPIAGTQVALGMIDIVVIPGLAFDRRGYRVGRGRGFYDRFLSQQDFKGLRIGLCFHEQLLGEAIPTEEHDIPMDVVITDREIVRCPAPRPAGAGGTTDKVTR